MNAGHPNTFNGYCDVHFFRNVVIRVDVFSCADTMVDFEITQPATFFDQTTVVQLELALSNQFSPAQVRISEVKDSAEVYVHDIATINAYILCPYCAYTNNCILMRTE